MKYLIKLGLNLVLIAFYTEMYSQVTADFMFDKSEGCGSLAVSFTDKSTSTSGNIVEWFWDLGGTISVKQNPGIIFTNPGQYTICLTVKTSTGATAKTCKEKVIKIYENPKADFSVDITTGCIPIEVTFKNLSKTNNGSIVSWLWDVGGLANIISTTDSLTKISTTYTTEGNYTTTLSITDQKGCTSTITKPNIVKVTSPPKVRLDYTYLSTCELPWDVKINNLDPDPLATYHWDFGNGQTFTGIDPPIINYNDSKDYSIIVIVKKGPCIDTTVFTNAIKANRITDFTFLSETKCVNQLIKFSDSSNYIADSLVWDFGDGTKSTLANPEHVYNTAGCYTIKLTKYIGTCKQEITKPCINILPLPIVNVSIKNGFSCQIPASVELISNANSNGEFKWHIRGAGLDSIITGNNQTLILNQYGSYNVDMTFESNNGCIVTKEQNKIDISKFEASLPFNGPKGCVPYDAEILDSIVSNVPLLSWYWEIGNPVIFTSSSQHPIFPVKDTGTWDVKLIVENIYGCKDTITRKDYIQGGTPPTVDFTATPLKECLVVPRQFTSLTSSNADYWEWIFNDSTLFSIEKDPLYTFSDFGVFDIKLKAFHNGCENEHSILSYIEVFKPRSAFSVKYNCDDPYTIDILNQSRGADIYYWVVELSSSVTDTIRDSLLASYTFPDRGLYFLSHYSKSIETGCEHIAKDSIFIVDLEASYTLDTIRGCAPLDVKVSTTVRDAVKSEFLTTSYFTIDPDGKDAIVTFNEGGLLNGPQLVVTDRHGCIDTFQTSTPVEVSKIDVVIDAPDVVCIPGSEIFNDVSKQGLANIVEREWYFSFDNQKTNVLNPEYTIKDPGSYYLTLKLTDSWGCVDSVKKDLLAVKLIPSFVADTISCTEKAVRFVVDSDPTFLNAYKWSFGDGQSSEEKNPLHFYQSEGVYDVCAEFFDSRGCSKKICKPKTVTIKDPIAAFTASPLSAPCPPLLSDFINMSANAKKFTWDFGDQSGLSYTDNPSHIYTNPGQFDITLYAELIPGCVDTLSMPQLIQVLGPKASVSLNQSGNCVPLQVRLIGESDKKYEYIWDFGDGKIEKVLGLNQNDSIGYSYVLPGRFIPKLLVTDENGCSRSFELDPVEVNNLNPRFIADFEPYCGLPSLVTIANATTSSSTDINYQWTVSGAKEYTSIEKLPTLIIDEYGKYQITLIASTVNCKDTITSDSLLEIAALPNLDFDFLSNKLCENTSIKIANKSTLDYGQFTEWSWDFGNNTDSKSKDPDVVFLEPSIHIVTLKALTDKGCQSQIMKTAQILPNTLINVTDDKTICIGDSIDLFPNIVSNTNYQIKWQSIQKIECDTCNNINVKPEVSTTYYINTLADSGCSNSDSIRITVIPEPGPKLKLSSDTIACENGTIEISILNYDSNHKYKWDTNDIGLDCYDNCKTVKASPLDDTYYSLIVTNTYGCFKEDSVLVVVERNIDDFLISSKIICEGSNTILTNTGGNNPIWDIHPTLSCSICKSPTATPGLPTWYTLSVTSNAGCKYRDSVFVDVLPLSSVDAGIDSLICKGETINLKGKGQGQVLWTSNQLIQNATSLEAQSTPTQSSIYILTTSLDECSLKDSVYIKVIEMADIEAIGDTICPDEVAILTASGNATNYLWLQGGKKIDQGESITVKTEKTTEYLVIGSRSFCKSDSARVTVKVHPKIDYHLDEDKYEIFLNSKVKFEATYDEGQLYTYQWSPPLGMDCVNCPEPTIQNIDYSQNYIVTVTDIHQCTLEGKVFVRLINKCSGQGFYIPNIFTPYNGDGINDLFKVYAEDEAEFISISIFDRWGEKVHSSDDLNEVWNGMYKGQELAQGVYTYIITARCDATNEIFNFAGDVTIID